jgi:hypothetical protein
VPFEHRDVNTFINRVIRTARERLGWPNDFPTIDEGWEVNIFRLPDLNPHPKSLDRYRQRRSRSGRLP